MKTILKNARLLPEYGYGDANVCLTVENKRIAAIEREVPSCKGGEVIDAGETF